MQGRTPGPEARERGKMPCARLGLLVATPDHPVVSRLRADAGGRLESLRLRAIVAVYAGALSTPTPSTPTSRQVGLPELGATSDARVMHTRSPLARRRRSDRVCR